MRDHAGMNGWDCLAHVAGDVVRIAIATVPLGAIWLRGSLKNSFPNMGAVDQSNPFINKRLFPHLL